MPSALALVTKKRNGILGRERTNGQSKRPRQRPDYDDERQMPMCQYRPSSSRITDKRGDGKSWKDGGLRKPRAGQYINIATEKVIRDALQAQKRWSGGTLIIIWSSEWSESATKSYYFVPSQARER